MTYGKEVPCSEEEFRIVEGIGEFIVKCFGPSAMAIIAPNGGVRIHTMSNQSLEVTICLLREALQNLENWEGPTK